MGDAKAADPEFGEIKDTEMVRAAKVGVLVGVLVVYAAVVVICMIGGAWSRTDALIIAVLPALFAGPFFGGVVAVFTVARREELAEAVTHPALAPHHVVAHQHQRAA